MTNPELRSVPDWFGRHTNLLRSYEGPSLAPVAVVHADRMVSAVGAVEEVSKLLGVDASTINRVWATSYMEVHAVPSEANPAKRELQLRPELGALVVSCQVGGETTTLWIDEETRPFSDNTTAFFGRYAMEREGFTPPFQATKIAEDFPEELMARSVGLTRTRALIADVALRRSA